MSCSWKCANFTNILFKYQNQQKTHQFKQCNTVIVIMCHMPTGFLLQVASLISKLPLCTVDPAADRDMLINTDCKIFESDLMKLMKNHAILDACWHKIILGDSNCTLCKSIDADRMLSQLMLFFIGLVMEENGDEKLAGKTCFSHN